MGKPVERLGHSEAGEGGEDRSVELLAEDSKGKAGLHHGVSPALGEALHLGLTELAEESKLHEVRHSYQKGKREVAQRQPTHLRCGQLHHR